MKIKLWLYGLILAVGVLFLSGCTTAERRGYSKIPQNTPSTWEHTGYVN